MKPADVALLALLRAVLCGQKPTDPGLSPEEWETLLRRAEAHKLLPLILDAASALPSCRAALRPVGAPVAAHSVRHAPPVSEGRADCPRYSQTEPGGQIARATEQRELGGQIARATEQREPGGQIARATDASPDWKAAVLEQVSRQAIQENEFLNLILALRKRGLEPVVVKGAVCRALYPKPLLRPSVDDDLLIPPEQAPAFHAALLELGLTADEPAADPEKAWELSYHKPESSLYIELHKCLFDPDSEVFRSFNEPFDGALDRTVPVQIQDVTLRTLAPTGHLLFLILHAFKHFLHSGFGLRIVADVCLYSRQHAEQIDFARIVAVCAARRCDRFTAALYRIGEKQLGIPAPAPFAAIETDETALLEDVLAAGLVGAEIDRLHSANITLGAVSDQNTGRSSGGGLRKSLFPSAKQLAGRYPWLEKRPWLLPAAWAARVASYVKNRGKYGNENPTASLRIGRERVKLLESYGVID